MSVPWLSAGQVRRDRYIDIYAFHPDQPTWRGDVKAAWLKGFCKPINLYFEAEMAFNSKGWRVLHCKSS